MRGQSTNASADACARHKRLRGQHPAVLALATIAMGCGGAMPGKRAVTTTVTVTAPYRYQGGDAFRIPLKDFGVKWDRTSRVPPTLPMRGPAQFGHALSTVDRVVKSEGMHVRELAWAVAGASAGALVRYWVDQMWSGMERALMPTLVLTAAAAVLVGFALVASIRAPIKTVLVAGGGGAASISAVATQLTSATPAQSIIGLAAFYVCAVAAVLLGMLVAFAVLRNVQREERR
jgi:fluoride ion exporter CrcB/FEX